MRLQPPCAYQGGKRRQAPEIVRHMGAHAARDVPFTELCCGAAAVSLELISRGKPPWMVTLVDAGPWGDVWRMVGTGAFQTERLKSYLSEMPRAPERIPDFLRELRDCTNPFEESAPYVFLMLQCASFGGLAVGVRRDGGWNARSLMRREDGSGRKTFSPDPGVLIDRMERICAAGRGITGIKADASGIEPQPGSVVYVDPPYSQTVNEYRTEFCAVTFATRNPSVPVYVSEMIPLGERYRTISSRKKGSFRGCEQADKSEYLSLFNAEWTTPEPVVERVEQGSLF